MKSWYQKLFAEFIRLREGLSRFGSGRALYGGIETQTEPDDYQWDGLKRGGDPAHPYFVFQYTLAGTGAYREAGTTRAVEAGQGFIAMVPGSHRYFLPPESRGWTFFWLILDHPYVVRRISMRLQNGDPVFRAGARSNLVQTAAQIFIRYCRGEMKDGLDVEEAAFKFLLAYERFSENRKYPDQPRRRLLEEVRQHVLANLRQSIDVEALARRRAMSRTHFSHFFKATTGQTPAEFVTLVRLEEASRLLGHTLDKLEVIARQTGFADANHFCKVFRRQYHTSPGAFRRQIQ